MAPFSDDQRVSSHRARVCELGVAVRVRDGSGAEVQVRRLLDDRGHEPLTGDVHADGAAWRRGRASWPRRWPRRGTSGPCSG